MPDLSGAALAGAHLISLILMGASRKVFGPEVVAQRLVPHRGDIGAAAFFSIGVGVLVQLGVIGTHWGPGGASHLPLAALAQVGYVSSLVARGDLPPAHPHRLVLLVIVWLGLLKGAASTQIVLEVASLWIVKLRLSPGSVTKAASSDDQPATPAPYLKSKTAAAANSKAKGKGKSAAAAVQKGGRKSPRRAQNGRKSK